MKNEAEIIWWKTVKQDVETTPPGFTEAASTRRGSRRAMDGGSIFKRGCSLSAIIIYAVYTELTFRARANRLFENFVIVSTKISVISKSLTSYKFITSRKFLSKKYWIFLKQ